MSSVHCQSGMFVGSWLPRVRVEMPLVQADPATLAQNMRAYAQSRRPAFQPVPPDLALIHHRAIRRQVSSLPAQTHIIMGDTDTCTRSSEHRLTAHALRAFLILQRLLRRPPALLPSCRRAYNRALVLVRPRFCQYLVPRRRRPTRRLYRCPTAIQSVT